ncbi:MAG: hypothetical protein BGP14_06150 [Sphingobacteriales bacterium 44-15]|nr:MAG: hypothetical protein BGP14_06150 [Sphingobacteriales bacterium 44-15]
MLTEEEKAFLEYWEQNRTKERKTWRQLLIGLPLGLLFALPILINLFSGWYIRADMEARSGSSPTVLIMAVLIIASFFAIFSKRYKWERNEQRYKELKGKEENE